jgi:hypothetical protein
LNVSKFLNFMFKYNVEKGLIGTSLVGTFFKSGSIRSFISHRSKFIIATLFGKYL